MNFLQSEFALFDDTDTALESVAGGGYDTSGAGAMCGGKSTCVDMREIPCGG
jgi:hypothetical protein